MRWTVTTAGIALLSLMTLWSTARAFRQLQLRKAWQLLTRMESRMNLFFRS